jgi:hypothetical protein
MGARLPRLEEKPVRPLASLIVAVAALVLVLAAAPRAQVARHLAAPPSDITAGRVVLPDPAALEVRSTYAVLELHWQRDAGGWSAALELPVERDGPLSLGLVGLGAETWTWALAAPGDEARDVEEWTAAGLARRSVESLDPDDPRLAVGLQVDRVEAGTWTVAVRTTEAGQPSQAWLALRTAGAADAELRSHLGTHRLLSDRAIAVVARLEVPDGAVLPAAGSVLVESAGGTWTQALWDDGLHGDGAAGDGELGAWVGPLVPGVARVAVQVEGRTAAGAPCVRTAHHAFTVEEPAVLLGGWATTSVLDETRLAIEVALQPLGALQRLHVSAEVWGPDAAGAMVPVAWLSHIGMPLETWGTTSLELRLDGRWLARAGTSGPLELRRVRVQDPDSHVLFDELASLPLPAGALPPSAAGPPGPITSEMLMGPPAPGSPPVTVLPGALSSSGGFLGGLLQAALVHFPWSRAVLLSHGYCSSGNIWPAADFTPPKLVFLDPNANRTNDEFAQLLAQAGAGKNAFGLVGHSQGGNAALHLLTYYQSGLDYAIGPRRIQSVASPYQGTPLASLGSFACGVNDDMTTSGAPLWLAGIPSWARKEVYYWTTQNSGSACNFFTNLILSSPNDGTIEMVKGQLPGAHSMGHKLGWCHTTGMSNPASYTDHVRNVEMNAQAAR